VSNGDPRNYSPSNTPPPLDGKSQLKFFGCPKGHGGDELFFKNYITWALFLAMEKFQSPSNIPPLSDGNINVLVVERGEGLCYHFGEKRSHPPILGDQRILVTIGWCGPKNFNFHSMVKVHYMETEIFRSAKKAWVEGHGNKNKRRKRKMKNKSGEKKGKKKLYI
jgi:hypothetical protein